MTNPTPSEFDARVDGIFAKAMTDYFDLMHGQDGLVGKPYQDAKRKIQAEATAAIRAAVREIVAAAKPKFKGTQSSLGLRIATYGKVMYENGVADFEKQLLANLAAPHAPNDNERK